MARDTISEMRRRRVKRLKKMCQAHAIFSAMKFKEIQIYAGKTDFLLEK